MNRQTSAWGGSKNKLRQEERWIESLCFIGLLLAACILFLANLESLPLRDWDEGTVAQVAKEIWQAPADSFRWLYPTLWGEPYFNKPPLVHALIAIAYSLGGVNEWTTRFPGALLSALSVLLLYKIGREMFAARMPAFFSALIYLTLLPVVRHGRLAMLDGALLCFSLWTIWCVLQTRRNLRWTLGVGIGFSLIALTKGMMALLFGAIALVFIAWDTPRLLSSFYLWLGLWLGSLPAIGWYAAQWFRYQEAFVRVALDTQSLGRIFTAVEGHSAPPWFYLLEILKYSWPWLLFGLWGLRLAWRERNWGWAKLVLVWSSIYLVAVSLMGTKLPWYILPIYPVLALAGGAQLAEVCNWPSYRAYPKLWLVIFPLLALAVSGASLYFALGDTKDLFLVIVFAALAVTLWIATILLAQRDLQFIPVLFWGLYISLLLLVCSPHWIWELNEAFRVEAVAGLIKRGVPQEHVAYISFGYERPSLNFYSDRRVISATEAELRSYWQSASPYFILDRATLAKLKLESARTIGRANPDWVLITKETKKEKP